MITQIKTFQAFQSSRVTTILKLARINIKVLLLSDSLFMNHPKKKDEFNEGAAWNAEVFIFFNGYKNTMQTNRNLNIDAYEHMQYIV